MTAEAKIFGIAGWSGSGKTTLVVKLLPVFTGRGHAVSTVKHAHHSFDIDTPGKDSYEHRHAGAAEVLVTSRDRWALMHENGGRGEPTLDEIVAMMTPVDLILIEGFKDEPIDKIEVHRPALGKPLLCEKDTRIVAVASDAELPGIEPTVFGLDDVDAIADFIVARCGLETRRRGAA
jgi:molybdopterin-guanine dinucleotide biosynthesis protein B